MFLLLVFDDLNVIMSALRLRKGYPVAAEFSISTYKLLLFADTLLLASDSKYQYTVKF